MLLIAILFYRHKEHCMWLKMWLKDPEVWKIIFEVFAGAILSFFVSIMIENQRNPKLSLEIEKFSFDDNLQSLPAKKIKVLQVKLINKKVKSAFSWWFKPETAIHCNATIQLLHFEDHSPFFQKPIHARWTYSIEPMTQEIKPDTDNS